MSKEPNAFLLMFLGNATIAVITAISFYYAWAFSVMWAWFVVPIFGAPVLSALHAWGLLLMVGLMRIKLDFEKKNTDSMLSGWVAGIFAPMVALGIGYFIKP